MAAAKEMIEADIPLFAKLIDIAGATSDITAGDVRRLVAVLRKVGKIKRGPVAFLVAPDAGRLRARLRGQPDTSARCGCSPASTRRATGWRMVR